MELSPMKERGIKPVHISPGYTLKDIEKIREFLIEKGFKETQYECVYGDRASGSYGTVSYYGQWEYEISSDLPKISVAWSYCDMYTKDKNQKFFGKHFVIYWPQQALPLYKIIHYDYEDLKKLYAHTLTDHHYLVHHWNMNTCHVKWKVSNILAHVPSLQKSVKALAIKKIGKIANKEQDDEDDFWKNLGKD